MYQMESPRKEPQLRPVLTLNEIAEQMRVSLGTAYGWAKTGKIPARKIGGNWRVDAEDFEAWYEEHIRVNSPISA
jgi:excisionase family DNA binding protein